MRLRITEIAERQGIGVGTLSDRSGLSITTIKKLWKDSTEDVPPTDTATLERVAKALEVSPRELIAA